MRCREDPLSGMGPLCSLVKTDWNWAFKASAFRVLSVTKQLSENKGGMSARSFLSKPKYLHHDQVVGE